LLSLHYFSTKEAKETREINMNKAVLTVILIFFFISGLFVVTFSPVSALEANENSWYTKKSMSQARYGLGVVAVDGKIFAIGGYGVDGYVTVNECYDPKTDTWVTLKSMPTPRRDFGIVAYEGKIYCIGGATSFSNSTSALIDRLSVTEVYDVATDSWSTRASLPFNERSLHAHVVDGKIFVAGARDTFKYDNEHILYMYDPVKDLWTQKADMPLTPSSGNYIVSAVVDDRIIFAGEFYKTSREQKVLIYDTKSDTWTEGKAGPTQVWDGKAGATTGAYAPKNVYCLGITSNAVYDHASDTWSTAKAMPTERAGFGVAVVEDVLYVIGGFTSDDFHLFGSTYVPIALNEQYVPLGYHGALPPIPSGTSSPITPPPSNPSVSTKPEPSGSLLNRLVVATVVILTCIVISTLFFYLRGKK
jgi:N-acetylneuraminic acid mutarotase